MNGLTFKLKILTVLVSSMGAACFAYGQTPSYQMQVPAVEVKGKRLTADQKGEAQQYSKNVSNAYLGKEYLERYRPDAAGDILKGLNGVYNMNTRTAGSAITPSIRGVSGKGRIPVTIDGTEQTVDVWQNNYGVAERNYVDPALFRSIAVEKGPSMTRGVKSGVGGSVAIRTLEAQDIIPENQKWGVQVKGGFSDGTVDTPFRHKSYLGWPDYRTLPGRPTADGATGMVEGTGERFAALYFTDNPLPRARRRPLSGFKNDKSGMVAAAFDSGFSDGLIAYSHRKKGNYFSGKRQSGGYIGNPVFEFDSESGFKNTGESLVPNMARLYHPGEEVFNTNTTSRSLLLKNNWRLPDNGKISLSYMKNHVLFGENNPFYNAILLGFSNNYNLFGNKREVYPIQSLESEIKTRSYKIGYEWKPENSRWLDLQANIWRVRTDSSRHQSGGADLSVTAGDAKYDEWVNCTIRNRIPDHYRGIYSSCAQLQAEGLVPTEEPKDEPPVKDAYRVKSGAEQRTKITRTGADISNRFRLSDKLAATLSANVQHEVLDEKTEISNNDKDIFNIIGAATAASAIAGPRAGRRHEWGAGLVFDWQPAAKLNIQAGLRYDKFWAYDDGLARKRRERKEPFYSLNMGAGGYVIGENFKYYELIANPEEAGLLRRIDHAWYAGDGERGNALSEEFEKKYGYYSSETKSFDREVKWGGVDFDRMAYYREKSVFVPYRNGRFQGPAFAQGQFDEKVESPQGLRGAYYKYLIPGNIIADIPYEITKKQNVKQFTHGVEKIPASEDENWPIPKHLKSHAWSPLLAVSYDLSENGRLHLRYAQSSRFPSVYEATTTNVNLLYPMSPEFDLKPERSINWEAGYTYRFAPHFSRLRQGDVRLTYYNNTIKNVIEFTENKNMLQFDKRQASGIELQSRIDSGKWFASFGANYRLKQRTCDKTFPFSYDIYLNRIPECVEGGFGATRFYQSMQPQYSVNADIGTRRFGERLELGMRAVHHSKIRTKQQNELAKIGLADIYQATGRPYHWRSATVFDIYGRYRVNKHFGLNFSVTNLADRYYLDPMSNVPIPAPGRAISVGFSGKF